MTKFSAIALAASLCATTAMAVEGPAAFVPSQSGATYPGTVVPVTAWKLVGSLGASAVQIAPRWALTANHVGAAVGQTFTNGYGTAKVDAVVKVPGGKADLTLVHLANEIVVPPAELPALLSDRLDDTNNNLPGQMLAAGRGGFAAVKAHWLPASEDATVQMPGSVGGVNAIPGDSGSGTFWYPSAQARPVLRSITTTGGNPVGPFEVQLSTPTDPNAFDVKAWIQSSIAGYGVNSGAAPLWTTTVAQAPYAARVPNLPQVPTVLSTNPTGAWMQWTPPKAGGPGTPEITSYVVRVTPGNAEYTISPAFSVLTITGLQTNKTYTATISAVNANGASGGRQALTVPDGTNLASTVFTTSPAPNAFTSLAYEAYTTSSNGKLKGCVRFNPVFSTAGVPATTFGVTNYARGNESTLLNLGTSSLDYCDLTPGANAVFFVAPWNHLTSGPSKLINVTPPAAVSGVPLNLAAQGVAITRPGGGTSYLLSAYWTKPNPPQPAATLNGYAMTVTCTNAAGASAYSLEVPLNASTTEWSVSNVPAGGKCSVILTANWSRSIPLNYAVTSAPIPLK